MTTPLPRGWNGDHFFLHDSLGSLEGSRAASGRGAGLRDGDAGRKDRAEASTVSLDHPRLSILSAVKEVTRSGSSAG